MNRLITTELFKLRKRSLTWILLYILIGIMVVLYLILYAVSRVSLPSFDGNGPPIGSITNLLGLPTAIPFAFSMLTFFGAVLAVILMASSVGNEFNWRTIRIALISSEGRLKFLSAKLLSVLVLVIIGMIIGVATGFAMSMITTAIGGYDFDFSFATASYGWDQFLQFWRTVFVILPFIMLGFLFAIIGRSAMAGIAVGIGVGFLEPIIVGLMRLAGGWVADIPNYLFTANIDAINSLNTLPEGFAGGVGGGIFALPSINHAFIVLGTYILVFLIIGFVLFRKRDVTG
jgi:ABC-type transport system involved in multi-copper enzyme maturation permease subunit